MTIERNYWINIAVGGRHWARVELGAEWKHVVLDKARVLKARFPEAEITLYHTDCSATEIEY